MTDRFSPKRNFFLIQAKWRGFRKNLRTIGKLKHVIFLIADHFEPAGCNMESLKLYFANYKTLTTRYADSYGNHPKCTWFYRGQDTNVVGLLAEMSRDGLGEIELHLHHGLGTENACADNSARLADLINSRLKILRNSIGSEEKRYGFIHGMWALDNSRGGAYCGVNNELQVLRRTGCFADFTFPAWGPMQPAKIESIYYAADDPVRPKSYNTGVDAAVGKAPSGDLLIFEGPEQSSLEIMLFSYLEERFNDGKRYRLHYVTAREAYNIVRAAEDGKEGDPANYRDYDVASYVGSVKASRRPPEGAKINAAFLTDDITSLCGTTRNLLENVKWIDKDKFNIFIYTLDGSRIAGEFKALENVKIRDLRFKKFNPSAYLRIINFLRSDNIEILHSYPFVSNMIGPFLAKIAGVRRIIASVHSDVIIKNRFLSMVSYGLSDRIIVVSEYLRKMLKARRGLPDYKIKTVYNSVDLTLFKPENVKSITREMIGISKKDVVIMTVANFRPEKGHEYLIKAMRDMKNREGNFKFLLVGTGPLETRIRSMSKELGVEDRILFMGYRDNIQELFSICDIFILPSVSEGFGISLIEAMAMKKPVIATAVGGIPEIVKDRENGLLVNPADPAAISKAVETLAEDRPLCDTMGLCGRRTVEEKFEARKRVRDLEGLYLGVLGRQ